MYYSAIGVLAILILLIENHSLIFRKNGAAEIPAGNDYRKFLFAVLAYYVTDALWGIIESQKLAGLLFADTTIYFIAMAACIVFWARYITSHLDKDSKAGRVLVYAGYLIAGLITLFAIINIFKPILFTVNSECVYQGLTLRYLIFTIQILHLLLVSVYAISMAIRKKAGDNRKYRVLAYFGLITAAFLIVQLWFPNLPLYAAALMLGTSLLHTFVYEEEHEEHKRSAKEAEKSNELKETIASLLDHMPGMVYTKDAETGVYLACNQEFADHASKETPEDVTGYTANEIFNAQTAAHFIEDDRMALSMDEPYIFFEDVRDPEGNLRRYQTTKLKYTDRSGRLCILGICQDVTDVVSVQREKAATKEDYEKAKGTGLIYSYITQTLSRGYMDMYYVDLDSEEYIEYRMDETRGELVEARRGWHFFEQVVDEAKRDVYSDDVDRVIKALDRKTLEAALDRNTTFVMTYRLLVNGEPSYVIMKASRMEDDDRHIILGITDVDEEMSKRRSEERRQEEQLAYTRLAALAGDFLCIYMVDPETGKYREFSAKEEYKVFDQSEEGTDFFGTTRNATAKFCYPEDLNRFLSVFTKENVLEEIERYGIFTVSYRLMKGDRPFYVQLKVAKVEETEGTRLIVGISDIDSQVRQEEDYVRNLAQAQINASIDALTGVKNKHAYLEAEERLNRQIAEEHAPDFAVVVMDVNDLKRVNDIAGHKAGDELLMNACRIICETFKRSPVFRIGGDEFAVIAQGNDYAAIDELVGRLNAQNEEAVRNEGVVIACGMSKYDHDANVASVFDRADEFMYENKGTLKKIKKA